jgi:hypothetical protein
MTLLQKARELESKLTSTLDRTVGGFVRSGAREPIEIVHAIVETAGQEIQSSGRGRRVFPFNAIAVTLLAPSRDVRARFQAVFGDGPSLRDRIAAHLRAAGCPVAASDLDVSITYEPRARKTWRSPEFDIEFARVEKAEPPAPTPDPAPPRIEITVLAGTAERRTYALPASARIDLGRCAEVRDSQNRLLRTNHVAFVEGPAGVNQTISRRHAHISYDARAGSFRLHDDGSAHGTGIVRQGRTLPVPRGTRGVRIEPGDEIALGEARLKVKFG